MKPGVECVASLDRHARHNLLLRPQHFGEKEHKTADWYEARYSEIEPMTEANRYARVHFKNNPCKQTVAASRAVKEEPSLTDKQ